MIFKICLAPALPALFLVSSALGALPSAVQAADGSAATAKPPTPRALSQAGPQSAVRRVAAVGSRHWSEVASSVRHLDALVASRQLSELHGAAFEVRDAAHRAAAAWGGSRLGSEAEARTVAVLGQIDALANALDVAGDSNNGRASLVAQGRLHMVLDRLAALGNQAGAGTLKPIGPVTAIGRVTDPVCRMVVDAATAPGHDSYLGQTYYFCSIADARAFAGDRARYAARYLTIAFGVPKTYALSLSGGSHLRAGQPVALVLAVRSGNNKGTAANGTLETKFQTVHEKLMHLIVVSADLSYFSHEHPKLGADGRFRLRRTFPGTGHYWLFADFTPQDGMNQLLRVGVKVSGAAAPKAPPLQPDRALRRQVGGYTVALQPSAPLRAGVPVLMTYSIESNGRPITDMGQYLGTNGHMMAINANLRDAVHTHTVAAGGAVTASMATSHGPRFTFALTPPAAGLTKIWAQFQRGGHVITVPFTLFVAPAPKAK